MGVLHALEACTSLGQKCRGQGVMLGLINLQGSSGFSHKGTAREYRWPEAFWVSGLLSTAS